MLRCCFTSTTNSYGHVRREREREREGENHGGESRGILHLYSDRTSKNIRHYFFNTQ